MKAKPFLGILHLLSSFPMLLLGGMLMLTQFAILAPAFLFLGIFTIVTALATRFYDRSRNGKNPLAWVLIQLFLVLGSFLFLWSVFSQYGKGVSDAELLFQWISMTAAANVVYPFYLLVVLYRKK
ncbi:MAG: hypothetical protein K1X56_13040 [Flavobacteriales bacterium]|nr:hypothetical protein [Flavobacteriales bacterium]